MSIKKESWAYQYAYGHELDDQQPPRISRCWLWCVVIAKATERAVEEFIGPLLVLIMCIAVSAFILYELYLHPIFGTAVFYFVMECFVAHWTRHIKYPVTPLQVIGVTCRAVARAICPEQDVL